MSREKELLKNTVVLSLGKFLPKMVSVITLPIVTAQLSKSEYGTFDLVTTIVMLLMPIATLQIQSAAFRFLIDCRGDRDKSAQIITNIMVVTIPISAIVSFGLFLFLPNLSRPMRAVIGLYFFVDIVYTTISQIARGLAMNKVFSLSSIVLSVVNGIGIVLSLQLAKTGLLGVIASLFSANLIALIYVAVKTMLGQYLRMSSISSQCIKKLVGYSWPMIPNNLSNWVLKLSDRLIITAALGLEANAIYAVANKIPGLLSIAQSVFVMAWQENASIAVKDQDAQVYYTKMFHCIFSLLVGGTAMLIGLTPIMFKVLIRGDYEEAYIQMPILILGMFFYCISAFQGGIYIAHKRTKSVGFTTIAAAALNLVIDLLFVNSIGITAGSISTVIAYFALYVFRQIDTLKFQKMDYSVKKQVILLTVLIIMLVICFQKNFILNIVNMVFGLIFCIGINKEFVLAKLLRGRR